MKFKRLAMLMLVLTGAPGMRGQSVEIQSLAINGELTWTNSATNTVCRIEWAPTVEGPWYASWQTLTNIPVTNSVMAVRLPVFYRVVTTTIPLLTNVTAQAALSLLQSNPGNTNFVVLDVRTRGFCSVAGRC